jgi:hypothetical protein
LKKGEWEKNFVPAICSFGFVYRVFGRFSARRAQKHHTNTMVSQNQTCESEKKRVVLVSAP